MNFLSISLLSAGLFLAASSALAGSKMIRFTNWTAFLAERQSHDGTLALNVSCFNDQGEEITTSQLPGTGVDNWKDGTMECEDGDSLMFYVTSGPSDRGFYQRFKPIETIPSNSPQKYILRNTCGSTFIAWVVYRPRQFYDQPVDAPHPDGYYTLYSYCY